MGGYIDCEPCVKYQNNESEVRRRSRRIAPVEWADVVETGDVKEIIEFWWNHNSSVETGGRRKYREVVDSALMFDMSIVVNMSLREKGNSNALHFAVENNNLALVKALVRKMSADANFQKSRAFSKYSPLHLAVITGQVDIAEVLLDAGADVLLKDASGNACDCYLDSDEMREILHPFKFEQMTVKAEENAELRATHWEAVAGVSLLQMGDCWDALSSDEQMALWRKCVNASTDKSQSAVARATPMTPSLLSQFLIILVPETTSHVAKENGEKYQRRSALQFAKRLGAETSVLTPAVELLGQYINDDCFDDLIHEDIVDAKEAKEERAEERKEETPLLFVTPDLKMIKRRTIEISFEDAWKLPFTFFQIQGGEWMKQAHHTLRYRKKTTLKPTHKVLMEPSLEW